MRLDEWNFSAQLAWRDAFIRYANIFSITLTCITATYLFARLIPEGMRSNVLAFHYTMYLGIDDVRTWPWVFSFPAIMLSILVINALVVAGVYRQDALASKAITGFSLALTLVWSIGIFYLVKINI